ncbi:hypothetical protein [Cupriavidus sp. H39]|uniref:hypothetical protein n=1 Tax=Cupriavidus sp. H39 TaxID=3401635 RepID=UPI003CFFCD49
MDSPIAKDKGKDKDKGNGAGAGQASARTMLALSRAGNCAASEPRAPEGNVRNQRMRGAIWR